MNILLAQGFLETASGFCGRSSDDLFLDIKNSCGDDNTELNSNTATCGNFCWLFCESCKTNIFNKICCSGGYFEVWKVD